MKATKITVEVVKETAKAALVKDSEGREAWVQKRSLKEGQVSTAVWTKAVANAAERKADFAAEKEFKNGTHAVAVARETEKALGIEFKMTNAADQTWTEMQWLPKSQCKQVDGEWLAPGWILSSREREAEKANPSRGGWVETRPY